MTVKTPSPPFLYHAATETALGWVAVLATERGVRHITLPRPTREEALRQLEANAGPLGVEDEERLGEVLRRLQDYYAGQPVSFDDIPLDLEGYSAFFRTVWEYLRRLPRGRVITYGQLAREIGRPRAARAVGRAMAANPVPPIVPCHRVIAHGGRLGGYGNNPAMKARLLRMEGVENVRQM